MFCLAVALDAHGAAIEKLENIRAAAREFAVQEVGAASENVHITVGRLDPRLRLAACATPLNTYFSPGSRTIGHTTVGVRCDGPNPWSLFVPLHIDRQITVAVALNNLPSGHVVGAADVSYELRSQSDLNRGYFAANEPLIGKITTRPLSRGATFDQGAVKKARIIQRGDRVTLALHTGGVAVRVAGTAMRDGALGERIPVRNLSSKRIIEGVVHESGVVLIGNPRADL
jgi:flagella basal body P-ring formation protein FlgA